MLRIKWYVLPVFVGALVALLAGVVPGHPKVVPVERVEAQPKEDPPKADGKFGRGLKATPKATILQRAIKHPFVAATNITLPASVAYVPNKLSFWGNNQYGDCVTAEEAFNQACLNPEVFITDSTVIAWARKYGFLNGAYLTEVMDQMQQKGFGQDANTYGIGPYLSVNFGDEPTLQAALSIAPVKIGIDADALPGGAGNKSGWYAYGKGKNYPNEDHCTSLCGYGPVASMFAAVGIETVPADWPASSKTAYLHFTWNTIGVVDHPWIMSTCSEAYVRNPTATLNGKPQPNPGPGPNPTPPVPPTPPNPNPPVPPTPGSGFTGTMVYKDGVLIQVVPGGSAPLPGDLDTQLKKAGLNPLVIVQDISQLLADIQGKKGFVVILGDLMKLAADLGFNLMEPAPKTGHLRSVELDHSLAA